MNSKRDAAKREKEEVYSSLGGGSEREEILKNMQDLQLKYLSVDGKVLELSRLFNWYKRIVPHLVL